MPPNLWQRSDGKINAKLKNFTAMGNFNLNNANIANSNTNTNNTNANENNPKGKKDKKPRKVTVIKKTDKLKDALRTAQAKFKQQLHQNLETKIECIQHGADRWYNDPARAWYDILTQSRVLTNLVDFNLYCNKLGVTAEHAAQHIVYEGQGVVNKILRLGVQAVVGERILMFNQPLYNPQKIEGLIAAPKINIPITFDMVAESEEQDTEPTRE
jgi:hypothetical protein